MAATLLVALPIAGSAWGAWRVAREALLQGPTVRVALVQGNVPQGQKWDPAYRDDILSRYLALTRDAARQDVDLVIWPESSTPFVFGRDGIQTEVMRAALQQAAGAGRLRQRRGRRARRSSTTPRS